MRTILSLLILAGLGYGEELVIGYRQQGLKYQGPGEWRQSAEPIWVYDYHTLRLRYRASGLPKTDAAVLTLRPGSVGPVTPGANNIENPFVAGRPVVAAAARDLVSDGGIHTLDIDLRGKVLSAQIDQLQFSLPDGARLEIDDLQFRGDPDVFPCNAAGPALPENVEKLTARGPLVCAGSPATSLRGRQSIRIEGGGRKGAALYLSLSAHFAGVAGWLVGSAGGWRSKELKESGETAFVLARVKYADGSEEEQFPMLLAERRHAVLNRRSALYVLSVEPSRPIASIELMDRSPHMQLVLFAAGLSQKGAPEPREEEVLRLVSPAAGQPSGEPEFKSSYRLAALAGRKAPGEAVEAELREDKGAGGRRLSLVVKNVSSEVQEFTLAFPSVNISPAADPADVYYLFPRQGAVISRQEKPLEATYSGEFPLQFVDVFAPAANRGTCVMVQDTSGRRKKFRLNKTGASVQAEVEYVVRLAPGETFRPPDAQVTMHGGDWRQGFEIYRKWLTTWYKPKGPRPSWLRSAFWARRDYPVGGSGRLFDTRNNRYTYDELIRDGELFGGIDFIDISGWALSDTAGRVGDYPIELGGTDDLRRNLTAGAKAGIPTGLYFEGYLIDKNSKVGRRHGSEWQLILEGGKGRWWQGGAELFACPYVQDWQQYLSDRVATVARDVGAAGVYLDEYGFGRMTCYSAAHGHPPGLETLRGELAMTSRVRQALDAAGMRDTMIYIEETPPDAAAPYFDAAFCYNLPFANRALSPLKLNLWRFAFPDIRLWDMLSIGIDPRALPAEDFRLSLWHGNGLWLKGHAETWYGEDLLQFIRRSRAILKEHAAAFGGTADPLVASTHPAVFINRFSGDQETVYTLFNASYRTVRFSFQGRERTLGPRDVDVVVGRRN
ncbi:MAG TPA: DUF6259 domain-containing protein [Bryobacteraceae bacterium]|nr:DUF6259 domain-containing protein [Bryobacteraceae bacterium]